MSFIHKSDKLTRMRLRTFIALVTCRMIRRILHLFGRGGTNLPGTVALRIDKNLLKTLAEGVTAIAVTGTNGKTTTSHMIEQILIDAGYDVFTNRAGANLISGITATYVENATLGGRPIKSAAVIECDEAAFGAVSEAISPKVIVATNVFRDQLDRYGEVTHTLGKIRAGIANSPKATLCINADDSLITTLADNAEAEVVYYGVNVPIYKKRVHEISDAPYCVRCHGIYRYDYVTFGHLGGFYCPNCGYKRHEPDVFVTETVAMDSENTDVRMVIAGREYPVRINLPGGYNIYNACAAAAAGTAFGVDAETIVHALGHFTGGFGRMEKFTVDGTEMRMILIKNPTACNQVLNFLSNIEEPVVFSIVLNDRDADSTDISWIWDVDFEQIAEMGDHLKALYLSGTRAEEMAMRLKYAGVPESKMKIIKDDVKLIEACAESSYPVYLMPTYTAMIDLRRMLTKRYGLKAFWH